MNTSAHHPRPVTLRRRASWRLALGLAALAVPSLQARAACPAFYGDVNQSGAVNVADVHCTILVALWQLADGTGRTPGCLVGPVSDADLDCDGQVNVLDVQIGIVLALGLSLPAVIDSDGSGCADACEIACGDGVCAGGETCESCPVDCGACPTDPDACCGPRATAGCGDPACEVCVCAGDGFCCDVTWDVACARAALEPCAAVCQCETARPCCAPHRALPGCDESGCEACVCLTDPFCCQGLWDAACVLAARGCPDCGCPAQPVGACCRALPTPHCGDDSCEQCACALQPRCCEVAWDAGCASLAAQACAGACACPAPQKGSCCAPTLGRGCELDACEACVGDLDGWCVRTQWNETCVDLAASACAAQCGCP